MKKIRVVVSAVWVGLWSALASVGAWAQCSPERTLPAVDFSKVGYRQGDTPVPYGKRSATLSYPEGRFTINNLIRLTSGQVLRGAGRDKTVLYFPNGLRNLGEPCGNSGADCYDWKNGVIRASGNEIGIEDLTIEFPDHGWCHYCGADNGGFNGIELLNATYSWVKNVSIRKADNGLYITGGSNNTVDGVHVYANTGRAHLHFAISSFAKSNLITNFRAYGLSHHGATGNWGVDTNVFSNGWGETLYLEPDHNCNGSGGQASCSPNMMYSNISGTIEGIQTVDRAGNALKTVLWNVGNAASCPADAQGEQLSRRLQHAAMTVYESCEWGGYGVALPATGGFTQALLASRGMADNAVSSVSIKKGYKARLYADDNYLGNSLEVAAGDNCLVDNGFNDTTSSIWLRPDGVTKLKGKYYLKNKNGLYMDVADGSGADGARLIQASYTGKRSQQFKLFHIANGVYQLQNVKSGKSVTVAGGSYRDGAAIEQRSYGGQGHQQAIVYKLGSGSYQLILSHSNKILKVTGGSSTPGAALEQWNDENQLSSQWELVSVKMGLAD